MDFKNAPACDRLDECRFQATTPMSSTLLYFPPIYNREGENLNPDGNKVTQAFRCTVCRKEFVETW